jgi:hypothetical protein
MNREGNRRKSAGAARSKAKKEKAKPKATPTPKPKKPARGPVDEDVVTRGGFR